MGRDHARILATSAAAELVGCFDVDPAAAERVPPGVPFSSDLEPLLDTPGLEALFVVSPQRFHEEHIRAGARARPPRLLREADGGLARVGRPDRRDGRGAPGPARVRPHDAVRPALERAAACRRGRPPRPPRPSLQPRLHARLRGPRARRPDQPRQRERDPRPRPAPVARRPDRARLRRGEPDRRRRRGPGRRGGGHAPVRERRDRARSRPTGPCPRRPGASSQSRTIVVGSDGRRVDRRARLRRRDPVDPGARPRSRRRSSSTTRAAHSRASTGSRTSSSSPKVRDGREWPIDLAAARSALAVALAVERSIELGRPVTVAEMG